MPPPQCCLPTDYGSNFDPPRTLSYPLVLSYSRTLVLSYSPTLRALVPSEPSYPQSPRTFRALVPSELSYPRTLVPCTLVLSYPQSPRTLRTLVPYPQSSRTLRALVPSELSYPQSSRILRALVLIPRTITRSSFFTPTLTFTSDPPSSADLMCPFGIF